MWHLRDEPRENFDFIYILTQSINSPEAFFQKLLTDILKSDAIRKLVQKKQTTKGLIKEIADKIGSIEMLGIKMELNEKGNKISYFKQFEKLLTRLEPIDSRIVIMVDEFQDTIDNIKHQQSLNAAKTFLQQNRELRQRAHPNIQFIYTGSMGLSLVVKKIMTLNVISDLNTIEVPPLSFEQAEEMIVTLFESYEINYEPTIITHLLNELEWWIPFHIQLAVQELIDVHDVSGYLTIESVEKAFTQLLHTRQDSAFSHYFSRLEQSFQDETEYHFALKILRYLAKNDRLSNKKLKKLANKYNIDSPNDTVVEALIFDGYIKFNLEKNYYSFNSLLLKKWWNKKNL